jgi:hypothetical protein
MADGQYVSRDVVRNNIREGRGDNLALDSVFIAFSPDDTTTKKVADGRTERWRFDKVIRVGKDVMSSCVV